MHKHLSAAAPSDVNQLHFLKSSSGLPNRNAPQQQQQQQQQQQPAGRGSSTAGRATAAAASGSSTPNSLYGFTPVSPVTGGDDVIAQAWEAVEQFYSSPNSAAAGAAAAQQQHHQQHGSRHRQQHYPAVPGASDSPPKHSRSSPQRQSAQQAASQLNAAAAVQFAAGLSLNATAPTSRQQPGAATAARPLPVSSQGGGASGHSGGSREQQQQQQQDWQQELGAGMQGALGVQLMAGSSGLMAAMGGWVVNQAISAAATTATAAAAAGAGAPAPSAGPVPAGSSQGGGEAAAAAQAGVGGSSSSWWKRFSSRAADTPAVDSLGSPPDPSSAAAAAEQAATRKGLKGSIKAAAKRHGLRRKASVAAANAAAGGSARSSAHDDGDLGGLSGSGGSFSDSPNSDGSMEYSQLLSQMDTQLRGAAAAGAAAAVASPGSTRQRKPRLSGAAARDAAAGFDGYADVSLDDDSSDEDGASGRAAGGRGGSWLAAVGLGLRAGSSSAAPGAVARGASSGAAGGYMVVGEEDDTGPSLAYRAMVLRGLLLWRSPGASAKALGLGIYVIMLLSNIPRALHYMQVTTVLPGIALLYLTYNLAKPWAIRLYCSFISPASDAVRLQARLGLAEEAAARAVVWFAAKAAVEAGSWSLALIALAHRALRARRFTTSCWTFVALWMLLLVSELRVINQTLLAMVAYAGLFCVPWMYKQFRTVIDKVVYDTVHFMTLLVVNAERWAYALAALAAALTWQLLEPADAAASGASLVVRCTASGAAGLSVLLWRVLVSE